MPGDVSLTEAEKRFLRGEKPKAKETNMLAEKLKKKKKKKKKKKETGLFKTFKEAIRSRTETK